MLGGLLSGAGSAAYVMNLGSGIGLPFAEGSIGTATGVFMLSTALGVRWAISKWERAKKRWWEDWSRVVEGLGRDLEVSRFHQVENARSSFFGRLLLIRLWRIRLPSWLIVRQKASISL